MAKSSSYHNECPAQEKSCTCNERECCQICDPWLDTVREKVWDRYEQLAERGLVPIQKRPAQAEMMEDS